MWCARWLAVPAVLSLAACATVPVPLKGEFAATTPSAVVGAGGDRPTSDAASRGERVRWGGEIIKVEPGRDATCFEILGRELDGSARPVARDTNAGRFIACRSGFYDPEVFVKGRSMTVTGTLAGTQRGRVGEFDYTYPRVEADVVYLWPKRPLVVQQRDPWPYDPFWGPRFGPYWGGAGWWGPPPVVIVKPKPDAGK